MTGSLGFDAGSLFDEPGLAKALQAMLFAMFASALVISALTLLLGWRLAPELALVAGVSCLLALVLSRSGRIRPAMLLPLVTIAYAVLHLAGRSDGIENIGLAILPVLIMIGSLVLDRLMLLFFAAGTVLAVAGMLALRYFVLRAERFSTNDMGDLFILALTCAVSALVGRLLTVRIAEGFRLFRNSENRYQGIFENVQDVYYEMHPDGILLELSPACAAVFGVPREGMIGRPLAPFCVCRSELDALLAALRAQGRVSNRELVIRDSGSGLRHVLVSASLQAGPKTREERVIGSIHDITELKRTEEALRESERTFRELLEGVQFVAIVTALNDKIIFCNDYALAITGWSKEEVIGRAAKELLDLESPLQRSHKKTIAPRAGRAQPFFEGSILEKNGGRRWIRWSSIPLRDLSGCVAGFARLGEDVTELRALRAEAARRESEERFVT
jgi:PAS domain S-box-containing protein